ncbi:hypothetical protein MKX01_028059, partial [Papaver californicum]
MQNVAPLPPSGAWSVKWKVKILGMICWSEHGNFKESIHICCYFGSLEDHK